MSANRDVTEGYHTTTATSSEEEESYSMECSSCIGASKQAESSQSPMMSSFDSDDDPLLISTCHWHHNVKDENQNLVTDCIFEDREMDCYFADDIEVSDWQEVTVLEQRGKSKQCN